MLLGGAVLARRQHVGARMSGLPRWELGKRLAEELAPMAAYVATLVVARMKLQAERKLARISQQQTPIVPTTNTTAPTQTTRLRLAL